ncbi:MAG: hypothetical protein ACKON8_00945 [Planctomycetota bacterium]
MTTSNPKRLAVHGWSSVQFLATATTLLAATHAWAGRIDAITVASHDRGAARWGGDGLLAHDREAPAPADEVRGDQRAMPVLVGPGAMGAGSEHCAPDAAACAAADLDGTGFVPTIAGIAAVDDASEKLLHVADEMVAHGGARREAWSGSGAAAMNELVDVPSWFRRLRLGTRTQAFVFYVSPSISEANDDHVTMPDIFGLKRLFGVVDDRYLLVDAQH